MIDDDDDDDDDVVARVVRSERSWVGVRSYQFMNESMWGQGVQRNVTPILRHNNSKKKAFGVTYQDRVFLRALVVRRNDGISIEPLDSLRFRLNLFLSAATLLVLILRNGQVAIVRKCPDSELVARRLRRHTLRKS